MSPAGCLSFIVRQGKPAQTAYMLRLSLPFAASMRAILLLLIAGYCFTPGGPAIAGETEFRESGDVSSLRFALDALGVPDSDPSPKNVQRKLDAIFPVGSDLAVGLCNFGDRLAKRDWPRDRWIEWYFMEDLVVVSFHLRDEIGLYLVNYQINRRDGKVVSSGLTQNFAGR